MVRSWRYVHDDVYGDLSLAFCRLTLHPWQLAPVVQNTVLTDRSRNHCGVRSVIGIRSMSMTPRPRRRSDRSLAVALIDLSRSLDSLSCGYSSWIANDNNDPLCGCRNVLSETGYVLSSCAGNSSGLFLTATAQNLLWVFLGVIL
ncbi:hypothetical protein F2Q69_00034814 [Brassica cretica]|uniref:Uncharacterized protein n=1 Tax=Brassica cretica TaxID=69181 RepID=A0A8S9SFP2_BRACR|nr:hypothetical protein F2Q69_00034814 [Brassica cretica]